MFILFSVSVQIVFLVCVWLLLDVFPSLCLQEAIGTVLLGDADNVTEDLPFYCQYCRCSFHNNGLITDCEGEGLLRPSRNLDNRTTTLYLQHNDIRRIERDDFSGLKNLKLLDLSNNEIEEIDVDSFVDLDNLETLKLHSQRMCTTCSFIPKVVFGPGVFKGLTSLKYLAIHDNLDKRQDTPVDMPVAALVDLVSLEEIHMDVTGALYFDNRFTPLENMSVIHLSGISGVCNIHNLTANSFEGVPNVRNLTLEKCKIKKIDANTFWSTPNVEYLDLSFNEDLTFDKFSACSYPLQYSKIKVLKLNSIGNRNGAGTELHRHHMDTIQRMQLEELSMNDNAIEYIAYGVFHKLPRTLKRLHLRRNKFLFRITISEAVFNNQNLEMFDAGDQQIVHRTGETSAAEQAAIVRSKRDISEKDDAHSVYVNDPSYNDSLQKIATDQMSVPPLLSRHTRYAMPLVNLSLKVLICSGSYSDFPVKALLNFTDTINVIEYVDWSGNFMPKLARDSFDGLSRVKMLNMSTNYIERITDDGNNIFNGLDSVEVLDLSNNLLGDILQRDNVGNVFSSVKELRHLNLSSNRIYRLSVRVFKTLNELRSLDLSDNYLESLDCSLEHLVHVSHVQLANNRLKTLPSTTRHAFSTIASHHGLEIDLNFNNLDCNCESIPFLDWLHTSSVKFTNTYTYYCTLRNQTKHVLGNSTSTFLQWLKEDCKSYQDVITASCASVAFILAIVVIVAVYINRWKLRYLYYMAKVRLDKANQDIPDEYFYDVFLSYGDGDWEIVAGEMVEYFETKMNLRLNIRDRDFEIGETIAITISRAIKQSRKTFLLVSRHFLTNKWCNFEMNMARMEELYTKRDVIVIVFLEPIPEHVLPMELTDLLREKPMMELPINLEQRPPFWERCKDVV